MLWSGEQADAVGGHYGAWSVSQLTLLARRQNGRWQMAMIALQDGANVEIVSWMPNAKTSIT